MIHAEVIKKSYIINTDTKFISSMMFALIIGNMQSLSLTFRNYSTHGHSYRNKTSLKWIGRGLAINHYIAELSVEGLKYVVVVRLEAWG